MIDIWAVYENPKDYPGKFVARRWHGKHPTVDRIVDPDVEVIRSELSNRGLVQLARKQSDDPIILETWL